MKGISTKIKKGSSFFPLSRGLLHGISQRSVVSHSRKSNKACNSIIRAKWLIQLYVYPTATWHCHEFLQFSWMMCYWLHTNMLKSIGPSWRKGKIYFHVTISQIILHRNFVSLLKWNYSTETSKQKPQLLYKERQNNISSSYRSQSWLPINAKTWLLITLFSIGLG